MKVFLGGTCANTTWRDKVIPLLEINYFNPVVEDWTHDCIEIEEQQKEIECNIHLYYITSDMIGVYSIAEAVQSSHNNTKTTLFTVNPNGFNKAQLKSLKATCDLIISNGGKAVIDGNIHNLAYDLNNLKEI
jgi:hypothetical protein